MTWREINSERKLTNNNINKRSIHRRILFGGRSWRARTKGAMRMEVVAHEPIRAGFVLDLMQLSLLVYEKRVAVFSEHETSKHKPLNGCLNKACGCPARPTCDVVEERKWRFSTASPIVENLLRCCYYSVRQIDFCRMFCAPLARLLAALLLQGFALTSLIVVGKTLLFYCTESAV